MDIEVLQDSLLEQRLEVESRLVAVDVWVAVQSQNSADVSVLEFDEPLDRFRSRRRRRSLCSDLLTRRPANSSRSIAK